MKHNLYWLVCFFILKSFLKRCSLTKEELLPCTIETNVYCLSELCFLEFIGHFHCEHRKPGTESQSLRIKYMMRIWMIHPDASWLNNYTFVSSQFLYRFSGLSIVKSSDFFF